jgi:hypothetical protein
MRNTWNISLTGSTAMKKACSELGARKDEFVSSAARRVLERSEWQLPKGKSGGRICPLRRGPVLVSEG